MSRISTVATFVTGMVVGAGLVYLTPPAGPTEQGPMGPPLDGQGGPGGMGPPGGMGGPGGPGMGGPGMGGPGGPGGPMGPPDGAAMPPGSSPGQLPEGMLPPEGAVLPPGQEGVAGRPDGAGPEPPPTAGTADGAQGPPLPAGDPRDAQFAPPPGSHTKDWLAEHLKGARALWTELADQAQASGDPAVQALAPEMRAVAELVPKSPSPAPPLNEVVILLSEERRVYDRMRAAGMSDSRVESQLQVLFRTPGAQR